MAYYTQVFNVNPGSLGLSQQVEDEFTLIQTAFASVDAQKAPLASPVFTGDPRAPTPAVADNDTSIATTAWVNTTIGLAAAITFPSLSGNSGKILSNNGTIPQWIYNPGRGATSSLGLSAPQTLTADMIGIREYSFTSAGYWVTLPDATTIASADVGTFLFRNAGSYTYSVRDSTNRVLGWVRPGQPTTVSLRDSSTAAGKWELSGCDSFGVLGNYIAATSFVAAAITEYSSGVFLISNSTFARFVVWDSNTNTWSNEVTTTWTSAGAFSYAPLSSSKMMVVANTNTTALRIRIFTYSGGVLSVGTEQTITSVAGDSTGGVFINVYSSTSALIVSGLSTGDVYATAVTFSGDTATGGTSVQIINGGATFSATYLLAPLSSTRSLYIGAGTTSTFSARTIDVAGTVVTANAAATFTFPSVVYLVGATSPGARYMVAYNPGGVAPAARILTVTGSAVSWSGATSVGVGVASLNNTYWIDSTRFVASNTTDVLTYVVQDNAGSIVVGTGVATPTTFLGISSGYMDFVSKRLAISGTTLTALPVRPAPGWTAALNAQHRADLYQAGTNATMGTAFFTLSKHLSGEISIAPCDASPYVGATPTVLTGNVCSTSGMATDRYCVLNNWGAGQAYLNYDGSTAQCQILGFALRY